MLLLGACQQPAGLVIRDAWIREAPPGAETLAAYLVLKNNLDSAVTLAGVSSESFDQVQIHLTTQQDGIARMRMIGELKIEAGQSIALQPGGMHLMLVNPKKALLAGDIVKLVMHFARQPDVEISIPVRKSADE